MNLDHKHVDWGQRYRDENTPWDRGRAHGSLQSRLDSGELAPPREGATCFVPGCGRGHDALALAKAGWKVTAMDVVPDLAGPLSEALGPLGGQFRVGNALKPELEGFDMMWEHTFLCAIGPYQRADWAKMAADVVRPGGTLAVLIFPGDKPVDLGGPPWGYDVPRLTAWLGDAYEFVGVEDVADEVEPRAWKQMFATFKRS